MDRDRVGFLRRIKVPHVFPLLLGVIFVCGVLTWIVPSGTYQRTQVRIGESTRTVVVPGTYQRIPKEISARGIVLPGSAEDVAHPMSFVDFFTAVPRGMESAADIIFLIFIVGGAFGILQRSGTIHAVIAALLTRFANSGRLLTVVVMVAVAIGGSTLGMGEELIPLVPLFLMISQQLGYDRIYGVALVFVGAQAGFSAATTNPFTVQIAQGIAEVPLGSGIAFRVVFLICALIVTISYVLRYGQKILRDPSKSILAGEDPETVVAPATLPVEHERLRASHLWILLATAVIFGATIWAMQAAGWWLAEMSGAFLLIGIVAAAIARLSVAETTRAFIKGMEEMVVAALVVGFAKGIQVVLESARVLDTVIHSAAQTLQTFPTLLAAEGMLVFQATLNFFIPSGSGQAAVTMPLMAPLADILGVTRQTAVFAFTCGDGFANLIIPTSAILMAMLGLARVPYEKWLRFVFPLFLQLIALSAVFLAIAVWIEY
jgi:uncharacterized ion transporter superfamily protein YfcC